MYDYLDDDDQDALPVQPIHGIWPGIVVDRADPEKLGRVRVRVPGIIDDQSHWAWPLAGGSAKWGQNRVPPVGADVFVQFLAGDIDNPVWMPGPHGRGEAFPEHEDPDVTVVGEGKFRVVVDHRPSSNGAAVRMIKDVAGVEETIVSIEVNAAKNSLKIFATTALQIEALGIVDIQAAGDVQIQGRKVLRTTRPIA